MMMINIYLDIDGVLKGCASPKKDIEDFLNNLDFKYDSGFGGQLLYGNVWFTDGTWLERGEYDGSEWWEYKTTPAIPEECRTINGEVDNTLRLN